MASNIDPSIPADNVKAAKSDLRQNFQSAKDEIETLQDNTSLAWQIALGIISL